ncbi:thioesterase family protein [Aspergillus neoniger CBS 115656]|uniref:Thioesterase family protein n=1 Tax=Aspergillus neoniger (strain CBS 115656) TaxID=1448310 RepID=A0A318Z5Y0_ASPNB|nr:hypothetical protein BO87DRAFT_438043 [Aspergillus neoniger CBS 115656]PYH39140.1 hypothetical protein BO87DRAFT_438043 [Aspergillus neoniger CBS 115656]
MENNKLRDALSVKRLTCHTYEKYFESAYANGQAAHGGFIAALFAEAARVHLSEWDVCNPLTLQNLHVEYVRRVAIHTTGLFEVEEIQKGTLTSLLHIRLVQDGQVRALCYARYGPWIKTPAIALDPEIERWRAEPVPRMVIDDEEGVQDESWIRCRISHDPYSRVRTHFDYILPRDSRLGSTKVVEWIGPRIAHDRLTNECIPMISDLWPQIPDNFKAERGESSPYSAVGMVNRMIEVEDKKVGMMLTKEDADTWVTAWYPTMTLELQLHKPLPAEGVRWLFQEARSQQLTSKKMDVELRISDNEGDLVAIGQLSVLVVPKERNGGRTEKI